MSVHVYLWDDADAPVLTSDAPGGLANLLRHCLVDGYGTGGDEKLPAGWSMDWDANSNAKIALLPGAAEAQNCHYYVDDTGTIGTGGNSFARIWMIENWAGFDASDNPTGTLIPSDVTWGRTIPKNWVTQSTAVPWVVVATDAGAYLLIKFRDPDSGMTTDDAPALMFFGRAVSYGPADDYIDVLFCSGYQESGWPADTAPMLSPSLWSKGAATHAAVARRDHSGITTGSTIATRCGAGTVDNQKNYCGYRPSIPYPDPVTGGMMTARTLIVIGDPDVNSTAIRGHLPGLLWPLHQRPLTHFTDFQINGRTYQSLPAAVQENNYGQALIDTTGPWE